MAGIAEIYHACRVSDTVFAMNPFLTQQNFYSQQLRALALVTAIEAVHLQPGRRNVSIVGAGVAGRTLAAAFVCLGASVTLIDKRSTPFEQYRNAGHRELHPNIIFWPDQKPTPVTALPFLNWAQAPADVVVKGMLAEWHSGFARKVRQIEGDVVQLAHDDAGVTLGLNGGSTIRSDLCVIATGFQRERGFGTLASPSYWSPTAVCDEGHAILISGSGDGGLIDVLSPILGTRVTRAAHVLATAIGDAPLAQDVAVAEHVRQARRRPGTRDSDDPCDFYTKVRMSDEVATSIDALAASSQQLRDRMVTLLYESTSPYSYTAAPINKLLLAHFSNGLNGVVTATRGSLKQVDDAHVMHCDDGTDACVDPPQFDRVMVRHGAEPALTALLSTAEVAQLAGQAEEYPEAARIEGYDRRLFRWTGRGIGRSGVTLASMRVMVTRTLGQLGHAYELDIVVGRIKDESFTGEAPIEVEISAEGRKRARQLKLFPMDLGPARVIVKPRATRRNAPYAIDA